MSEDPRDERDGPSGKKQRVWDEVSGGETGVERDPTEEATRSDDPDNPTEDELHPPAPPEIPGTDADDGGVSPTPEAGRSDLQPLYRTRSREFYLLWSLAVLAYGLGDTLTTGVVLVAPSIGESNPVVQIALQEFGIPGFVAVKAAVFAALILISVKGAIDNDTVSYYGPPLFAIVFGSALTLWNLRIILGA